MSLRLQLEIESIERSIDELTAIRENLGIQIDTLASVLETKRGMLAFESTEYSPREVMPVNLFGIEKECGV